MPCTKYFNEFTDDNGSVLYRITLENVVCDQTVEPNLQTWTYFVEKVNSTAHDISNWALELCPGVTVENKGGGDLNNPSETGDGGNCLKVDNCPNVTIDNPVTYQIKWNTTGGTFSFTLQGCYDCRESRVAIKTGGIDNKCYCGTICGPSCEPGSCTPPTRGVLFS